MFQMKVTEKSRYILCLVIFFRKSCRLWDNVEKFGAIRDAKNDTMWHIRVSWWISKAIHAHEHKHAHAPEPSRASTSARVHTQTNMIYSLFSTPTIVSWTRLSVTLGVHCLSCLLLHRQNSFSCKCYNFCMLSIKRDSTLCRLCYI
jgi:hypothetical protein